MLLNKIKSLNYLIIFLFVLLSFIGAAGLYSAADGSYNPWSSKHLIRLFIFLLMAIMLSLINLRLIYKHAYSIFILCLLLLFSVELIGEFGKGASRWIRIFGFSIQPSEIIKIGIIISLAKYYNDIRFDNLKRISYILIPLTIIFLPFLLTIIQPDLGTAISIFLLGVIILFSVGVRLWKFILGLFACLVSLPVLWNFIKPYQRERVISFLNPESDPLGSGYQLIQSKIALGSGSLTGKGFLKGTQAYLEYLPEKQTDFIFTLIGEEFGFIGSIFIISLFFIIISISFYISIKSNNLFGKILAIGIATNMFIYVVFNISMVTGLMPVVGIPLPLVSYGGTVMLSSFISLGILLNIDLNYRIKKISKNA